jgi:hypothetical protein
LAEFEGEPYCNYTYAQEIILNSTDSQIITSLFLNGLDENSQMEDWRIVAEGTTPLAEFNFTRYESGTVRFAAELLQDYLKNIGIKLNILDSIPWNTWIANYVENPNGYKNLTFSFSYQYYSGIPDPISIIGPYYGKNENKNCYGLFNDTWNDQLNDTYTANDYTPPTREQLFHKLQIDFATVYAPSFYILQWSDTFVYNQDVIDSESIGDLMNIYFFKYWFNCHYTPFILSREKPIEMIVTLGVGYAVAMVVLVIISAKINDKRNIINKRAEKFK